MAPKQLSVLFVDYGNTGASLMAEAILRKAGGSRFRVQSAGIMPGAAPANTCIKILRDHQIPVDDLYCKNLDLFRSAEEALKIDVIIFLGDKVKDVPPALLGVPARADWPVENFEDAAGTAQEAWKAMKAFTSLSQRVGELTKAPLPATRGEMQSEIQRIGKGL